MNDIPKTYSARIRALRLSRRTSRRPRAIALGCALALGLSFGAATSAQAATNTLPLALTSYVDTSGSVVHLFYLASDGGVYSLSAPLGQASTPSSWSCASALPPMQYQAGIPRRYLVSAGGMMPGSNLAASYDGTTGHLYYMGSDYGLWAADGNPPNATTAHSVSQLVGSSAPAPTSQAQSWCLPSSIIMIGTCYQGVNNPATIATTGSGPQDVFYQGTDASLHHLRYGSSWGAMTVGIYGANAVNGKGLSATSGAFGTNVFFDDAVGDAEAWELFGLLGPSGFQGYQWQQQATFNVDFQGFLGSSLASQSGLMGLQFVGPDPSQTLPALDVANDANATNTWGASSVRVPVVPAGPIVNISAGWEAQAPNGQTTWTYFVGSDGQVHSSTGWLLTDRAQIWCTSCVTEPAITSTANTAYTPLTGFYSAADTSVHLFYIGANQHVFTIVISQQPGASQAGSVLDITPSSCPTTMN